MIHRSIVTALLAGCCLAATPASAARYACGDRPCNTTGTLKGTSIFPSPDEFGLRGDLFSNVGVDLAFGTTGFAQVDLGFAVNFGFGNVSTLYVGQNGLVTFAAPTSAILPTTSLSGVGGNVIAPFFAPLTPGAGSGDGRLGIGDVIVQTGFADPYADGGAYRREDALQAVRISWNGLANAAGAPVYSQLLLTANQGEGLSTFEFRYGTVDDPGEAGAGSVAGFVLGNTSLEFNGPYEEGIPTFFEFSEGAFVGQGATMTGSVPEPATWAQLILGFGMIGFALRTRRRAKPRLARVSQPC
jgi:hypothetical protein